LLRKLFSARNTQQTISTVLSAFVCTLQKGADCVKAISAASNRSLDITSMNHLHIKAGPEVYELIKDGGFNLDMVAAYFAPAGGPRWLVASGFDLALLKSQLLGRRQAALLVGSSAGAWRLAAWLQPEAETSYHRLIDAYIAMPYHHKDTPRLVFDALGDVINAYLSEDALSFALANKQYRLAVITVRAKHLLASDIKLIQWTGIGLCFLANWLDRSYLDGFAERTVFYTGAKPPDFCFARGFRGRFVALSEINFRHALLASAAIPLVVAGVRDIFGAPTGVYRDGGLVDYHLTHRFATQKAGVTLFFHHQERIIPGWLDKRLTRRKPAARSLNNVLMVYPTNEFVTRLPDERIPDRIDYLTYINDPRQRMTNWRQVVARAAPLGEEFLELVASGKIRNVVEKLD